MQICTTATCYVSFVDFSNGSARKGLPSMSKNPSISLRSQWLGARLRKARAEAGLTLQEVADQLQVADTTLGRFEKGTVRIRRPYVKEMVDFYGISNRHDRDALMQLNEDAWRKDWWEGDTSDLETAFLDYTWLESRVNVIRQFEAMLIPGLLQTRDYATAVMERGPSKEATPDRLERMVDLRLTRQHIVHGDKSVQLSVIVDESVTRRPIGGPDVLREQLQQLLTLMRAKHVELRCITVDSGWHPGVAGSFTIFDMPDPYPNVAYTENLVGRTFLEDQRKVTHFRQAYDELCQQALSQQESDKFIRQRIKDLE